MKRTRFVGCVLRLLLVTGITVSAIPAGAGNAAPSADTPHSDFSEPTPARVALVIGNAGYNQQSLRTPHADAHALSRELAALGFDVLTLNDTTQASIGVAFDEFERRLRGADLGLFYFAGHAVQFDGSALLLPVDTQIGSPASLRGVDLHEIVARMSSGDPGRTSLILVDACLTDPFADDPTPAGPPALVTTLPERTLVAFASAPGGVAFDGAGDRGVFTDELLKLLPRAGLTIDEIFGRVQREVGQRTGGAQRPWFVSSLHAPLVLHTGTVDAPRDAYPPPLLASASSGHGPTRGLLPQDGEARIELEFWKSIEDSTDASDYEAYLEAYPEGRFAPLAKARAKRYGKPEAATEAEPSVEEMDIDYVAATDANLRQAPSSQAQLVGRLGKGTRVHVTGRVKDGKWYRVRTASGDTAYVYAELLVKTAPSAPPVAETSRPKARAPAPVVAKPPTPVPTPTPAPSSASSTETLQDCPTCPVMVVVPAGSYTMGDDRGDRSERPAHKVSIERPFAIGKYEVTTGQWRACVAAGHCSFEAETSGPSDDSPVRDVSWNDAQQYTRWLSGVTKQSYRLPTEAEWEYASRAGTRSRFWWGDEVGTGRANCRNCGGPWAQEQPGEVGAFPANPFGLHGMNGGVWEWVADCWHKSHDGAPTDGSSRERSDCREHVIRGGSWRDDATYVHSASRFKYDTDVRYLMNGFRVAKTLQ